MTGQLGDVMKESAQAALTYLKANAKVLGLPPRAFEKKNFHIHVPAGAVPKDGPSAGIAIMMSMASLLFDRPLRAGLTMTGEITLKGAVLPVGGIKEKVLGDHRNGFRTILLPRQNQRDLADVPDEVTADLKFKFLEQAGDALRHGFSKPRAASKAPRRASRAKPKKSKSRTR